MNFDSFDRSAHKYIFSIAMRQTNSPLLARPQEAFNRGLEHKAFSPRNWVGSASQARLVPGPLKFIPFFFPPSSPYPIFFKNSRFSFAGSKMNLFLTPAFRAHSAISDFFWLPPFQPAFTAPALLRSAGLCSVLSTSNFCSVN